MNHDFIYKHKKKILVLGVLVILVILAVSIVSIVENALNSVTLSITVAPTEAKVLLNGKEYSSEGEHKIKPGEYNVEIRADGFISKFEDFTVKEGDTKTIMLFLEPEDGNPNWFYDNPRDSLIVGAVKDAYTLDAINQLREENPILNDLPIDIDFYTSDYSKKISYTISYELSVDKTSFKITIDDKTGGNYEAAISKIRDLGYEPSGSEIVYNDISDQYKNYRAE